jgi:hypothetical protein
MQEGLVQGDPLSPLLFSLALQPVLIETQAALTAASADQPIDFLVKGQVLAYLDDIIIVGPDNMVMQAFDAFKSSASRIGLEVNTAKCGVLAPSFALSPSTTVSALAPQLQARCLDPGIITDALPLLGSFVGIPGQERDKTLSAFSTVPFERVTQLDDKQLSLMLLRECIGKSTNHIARIMPPSSALPTLQQHDDCTLIAASRLLEVDLPVERWLADEISLPLKHGGLGLTNLSKSCHIAYLSSVCNVMTIWQRFIGKFHPFLKDWTSGSSQQRTPASSELQQSLSQTWDMLDGYTHLSQPPEHHRRQVVPRLPKVAADLLCFEKVSSLQSSLMSIKSDLDKASFVANHLTLDAHRRQFISKSGYGASAFLQTVPSEQGLSISNRHFTIALRLRFRLPILTHFGTEAGMPCFCGRILRGNIIKVSEEHLLNCNGNSMLSTRHNFIRDVLIAMIKSVGLKADREARCSLAPGVLQRYDISVDRATDGAANLRLDITMVNPNAAGHQADALQPLAAANRAVQHKIHQYSQFLEACDKFMPLAFEVFGSMHGNVQELLSLMSLRVHHSAPMQAAWTASTFAQYWTQRISVAQQRLLAANIDTIITKSYDLGHARTIQAAPVYQQVLPFNYDALAADGVPEGLMPFDIEA